MDDTITTEEKNTARLRLFDLSLCDSDIAETYKEYGVLNYQAERPLFLQLSRDIRNIISLFQSLNLKPQISSADNGEKNCGNRDDES